MKIKKFFSTILVFTILISSLSLQGFANGVFQINGTNPTYVGKNVNLGAWITSTIPSFNGVPSRVPGDVAFYSGKGEIKLNITDQNKSYFENGGSVNVYVKKAYNKFHWNPFHWTDWLSYKPEKRINSFKINGPNQSIFQPLSKILSLIFPDNTFSFIIWAGITYAISQYESNRSATVFALSTLFSPVIKKLVDFILSPINNLINNVNENNVTFDYGIVLTDNADENVLNPNVPNVEEINEKALNEWQKKEKKEKDILKKYNIKKNDSRIMYYAEPQIPKNCHYTEADIDKIKKDIEQHKETTYAKLANTSPINDGYICTLDKNHPSQTFRFVINNQSPGNPNNADLFALALQNNSINLNQADSRVNFIAAYNAISPDSDINARLSNVPVEVQRKINLITHMGNPGTLSRIYNSIINFFKNNFTFGGGDSIPVVQEGEQQQNNNSGDAGANRADAGTNAGDQDDPFLAAATEAVKNRNAQILKEATEVYKNNPTTKNFNNLNSAGIAYKNNRNLNTRIVTDINNKYNTQQQQQQQQPQRPWYRRWF